MAIIARHLLQPLFCSVLFWLTAYWWFVPNDMRFRVPLAQPHKGFAVGNRSSDLSSRGQPPSVDPADF